MTARPLHEADLVLTDSGFMVLLWNLLMRDRINRVSGLEYLHLLLRRSELRQPGASLWVMPSAAALERNREWLSRGGFPAEARDFYVAPKYPPREISDPALLKLIESRRPRHIIIGIGGGVQEKLGLYLKRNCAGKPAIHCIGAAIGFLSGDQVRIPAWADRLFLGWLFRCSEIRVVRYPLLSGSSTPLCDVGGTHSAARRRLLAAPMRLQRKHPSPRPSLHLVDNSPNQGFAHCTPEPASRVSLSPWERVG